MIVPLRFSRLSEELNRRLFTHSVVGWRASNKKVLCMVLKLHNYVYMYGF